MRVLPMDGSSPGHPAIGHTAPRAAIRPHQPSKPTRPALFKDSLRTPLLAGLTALNLLAGCANRGPKAAPDPERSLKLIALLPVLRPPVETGRLMPGNPGYMPMQPMSPSAALAVSGIGLVTLAILSSQKSEADALAAALNTIGFDPATRLNESLRQRLEAEGLEVQWVSDELAGQVRANGNPALLADVADAVLDIQLSETGYYDAGRPRGYSPMLGLQATLSVTRANNDPEYWDYWDYWADWKGNAKYSRYFVTPASMNQADVAALAGHTDAARADLEATLNRVMERSVQDVKLRATTQPRLP